MSVERMVTKECIICGQIFDAYERQEMCYSCDNKMDEAIESPKFQEDIGLHETHRICDRCDWYEEHPSGVAEICQQHLKNQHYLTMGYRDLRFNGVVGYCKGFKSLRKSEVI